jgi:hypothetical protein
MRRLTVAAIIVGILVLFVAVFLVGRLYGESRTGGASAESCAAPDSASEPAAQTPRATVTTQSGVPSQFTFGRGAAAGPRRIPLDLSVALPVNSELPVRPGPFVRSDGVHVPADAVRAWGMVTGERTAEITVCVEARTLTSDPGVYRGRILINGPGVESASLDLVFDAYPPRWRMILLALGLCFIGSIYIYILRRPTLPAYLKGRGSSELENPSVLSLREFWFGFFSWATHLLGILTIASGLLAAFVPFNAQYLENNKPWSSSVYLGFIGTVTSAFIVGATAGRLAQNVYQKSPDGPSDLRR